MKNNRIVYSVLVGLIIISGIAIRVIKFPEIPIGLNIDEAVSAYEAFSILETGLDKWGNKLPAYFPGWGSGQNVLQAYLTIPFIQIFGLTIFSARLPALLFGILTLPLFYFCIRPLGKFPALFGTLFLCLVPWHFMLSRWALESNLVPFFMLLGCTLLARALITGERKWIIPCLLPFALTLYAYGTTVLVLPIMFGLTFLFYFNKIRMHWVTWLLSLILFLGLAFPFLLFFVENYILKANLLWTDHLFFSTTLLPSNRLEQVNAASWGTIIQNNWHFLRNSFHDGTNYNVMPKHKLLFHFTVPLSLISLLIGSLKVYKERKNKSHNPGNIILAIFLFWAIASLSLFFSFELNINRFNHFFLPAIVLTVWLIHTVISNFSTGKVRLGLQLLAVAWVLLESSFAIRHYFTDYPKNYGQFVFNPGLKEAFAAAQNLPVEQVRLSDNIITQLSYIYALFYTQYPPQEFQQKADFKIEQGIYRVNSFGKYIFYDEYLAPNKDFGYLLRKGTPPKDSTSHKKIYFENEFWEVGIIRNTAD